jgi:Na+-translocating ferredoxin:NAD+ oxidoreductase subunit B
MTFSIETIDAILPQTQCTQCGYNGCQPYAQAISEGHADINQCPPGGAEVINALARLLKREAKPLNQQHGVTKLRAVATIDENICIGCTLCIKACPVDAIIGASKHMHTVISAECTGCELCLAPCPVDCIVMRPPASAEATRANPALWRQRYTFRLQRLMRDKAEKIQQLALRAAQRAKSSDLPPSTTVSPAVSAAIKRARAKQTSAKK